MWYSFHTRDARSPRVGILALFGRCLAARVFLHYNCISHHHQSLRELRPTCGLPSLERDTFPAKMQKKSITRANGRCRPRSQGISESHPGGDSLMAIASGRCSKFVSARRHQPQLTSCSLVADRRNKGRVPATQYRFGVGG
ncbi:hypothetical protein C8Q74DRAFT_209570 [Fomes fomentarius]|nr:hypothetical protein C8Q74DRAFT_209570 [Fomes fomentarius]